MTKFNATLASPAPYARKDDGFDLDINDDHQRPRSKNRQLNAMERAELESNRRFRPHRQAEKRNPNPLPLAISEKRKRDAAAARKSLSHGAFRPTNSLSSQPSKSYRSSNLSPRSGGALSPMGKHDFYLGHNKSQVDTSGPRAARTHEIRRHNYRREGNEVAQGMKARSVRDYKGRQHGTIPRKSAIQLHDDPDYVPHSTPKKQEKQSKPQEIIVLSDSEEDVAQEEEEIDKQEKKEFGHFPSLNAGDFHIGSMHLKGVKVSVKFGRNIQIHGSEVKIDIEYENVISVGLSEPVEIESYHRYICFIHVRNSEDIALPGYVDNDAYDPSSEKREKKYLVFLMKTGLDGFSAAFRRIMDKVPNHSVKIEALSNEKICALTGVEFKPPPRRSERRLTEAAGDDKVLLVYPEKKAKNTVTVRIRDFNRLWPGEFLNDSIIEFYLRYTLQKAAQDNQEKLDSIHIFSTFLYSTLNPSGGADIPGYEKVSKWTQNVDIFKKKLLIMPINENFHWTIVFILRPDLIETWNEDDQLQSSAANAYDGKVSAPTIVYMDSFQNKKPPIFHMCRAYLKREWADKKPNIELKDRAFSPNTVASRYAEGTEQRNFCDCGLFLLKYAEYVMNNLNDTLERMTVKIEGMKIRKLLDPKAPAANTYPPYKDAKNWFRLPKIQAMREEIQSLICELGGIDEDDRPECPDDIKLVIQAEARRAKKQEAEEAARKKRAQEREKRADEPRTKSRRGGSSISPALERAKNTLQYSSNARERSRNSNIERIFDEELPDKSPRQAFARESPTEDGSKVDGKEEGSEKFAEMDDSDEEIVDPSNIVTSRNNRKELSEFDQIRLAPPTINNALGAPKRVSATVRDSPRTISHKEALAREKGDLSDEDKVFQAKLKSRRPKDADNDVDMEPETQDAALLSAESD